MAEAFYKKELRELSALPENKRCVDCGAPSPQWASVQHGTLICLECSGIHRSFGVHISFVRSTTMDKWTPEQLTKLRNGGNAAFNEFVNTYPSANNGGYPSPSELKKIVNNAEGTQGGGAGGMSAGGASAGVEKGRVMREKYGCWALKEYRDKLAAISSDPPTDWSPSPAPTDFTTLLPAPAALAPPGPANGTRARGGRTSPMPSASNGGGGRSGSPFGAAGGGNGAGTGSGGGNEDFFARMGEANAQRKEGVPPSQGGKYTGFGSSPDPPASSQTSSHPSFALSSHAAPSLSEFQTAPLSALTKSWGIFSSAVSSAGKEIHSSVIQPGVARAGQTLGGEGDGGYEARELAAKVAEQAKATTGWLSSMAGEGWTNLNSLANQHASGRAGGGLDFTERLGQMGLGPTGSSIAQDHQQGGNYNRVSHGDEWNDDGFTDDWDAPKTQAQRHAAMPASKPGEKSKKAEPEWDDEWKEF